MAAVLPTARRSLRAYFWVGISLLIVGHVLIFARTPSGAWVRPLSDYWFAAVWYGYILSLDALIYRRDGQSLFVSHRRVFLAMLPLSAAMWYGFEWINNFVQNWHYLRPYDVPEWWSQVWSMVFFSTVIPAMWETADWVGGSGVLRRLRPGPRFSIPDTALAVLVLLGIAFFLLPAFFPQYFFPLIWGFAALILDPINYKLGNPSILGYVSRGQWRIPLSLYIGGHVCGILWEFWNYWAFPKWYYVIPYVGFLKIFEMPLLGYIGYGPFALETYAVFWFFAGVARGRMGRSHDDLEMLLDNDLQRGTTSAA